MSYPFRRDHPTESVSTEEVARLESLLLEDSDESDKENVFHAPLPRKILG